MKVRASGRRKPIRRSPKLTLAEREQRRVAAARLFGEGLSLAEIARRVGVTPGAVSHWYGAWKQGGRDELKAKPRSGRPSRLTAAQWERLANELERGPLAAGFDAPGWTLERVAFLIKERWGIEYHPRYLERPLRRLGFAVKQQTTWVRTQHAQPTNVRNRELQGGRNAGTRRSPDSGRALDS